METFPLPLTPFPSFLNPARLGPEMNRFNTYLLSEVRA